MLSLDLMSWTVDKQSTWHLTRLRLIYKLCLICDAIYKESICLSPTAFGLSRSFAAVCASPYDRSAVRLTTFSSHPQQMDIHSIPRSFQHTLASLSLSLSLFALSTISLCHPSWLLSAVPYMHSQSVSFSRLYTLDEISHSEYIRKGVRERGERDEDELICYRMTCLRYDRSLHHADHLFGRHAYFLWHISCISFNDS